MLTQLLRYLSLTFYQGGMDIYVRQLSSNQRHDQFYTNDTIVDTFKNYTSQIVSRYKNNTSILGWYVDRRMILGLSK